MNLPLTEFFEPLITVVFLPDGNLFIQVYHRFKKKQYSFTYSYIDDKMLSDVQIHSISNATIRNFPVKSFYSEHYQEIYTFYRQGQSFTHSYHDPTVIKHEKVTDSDLGNMYLVFDKALITRSSSSILFFKKVFNEEGYKPHWHQYYELDDTRG